MQERQETITAPDGQTFGAHLAVPERGSGPGLLVLQEIFGVNDYIRDVCRRLAEVGYVAMAPDVFWRLEPGVELPHDEDGLQRAFDFITRYDWEQGIPDLVAALAHLRALPETGGRAGALGFCFGGTTSFALGCVADPDVVVSYYGSGVPDWCTRAQGATTPMLFHFGATDAYISSEQIASVQAWAEGRDNVEVHVYEAGHAFDNSFAGMFSDATAAETAWKNTTAFLAEHLPT